MHFVSIGQVAQLRYWDYPGSLGGLHKGAVAHRRTRAEIVVAAGNTQSLIATVEAWAADDRHHTGAGAVVRMAQGFHGGHPRNPRLLMDTNPPAAIASQVAEQAVAVDAAILVATRAALSRSLRSTVRRLNACTDRPRN